MKPFYGALGVVAIVGAGLIAYLASSKKESVVTLDPNLPLSTANGYVMGSPDAKVEIAEFGDFECPGCGDFALVTEPDIRKRLVETGIIRFRFFDYPLPQHTNALSAHVAAGCADEQQKFWEMHDMIFAGQDVWSTHVTANPKKVFKEYAGQIPLDVAKWEECYDARRPLARISANKAEGDKLGVRFTPSFVINGKLLNGKMSYDSLKAHVDRALADTSKSGQH